MKMLFRNALAGCLIFLFGTLQAQEIQVSASMDSTSIFIGEQTHITLEATQYEGQSVHFPQFSETLIKGIEVLSILPFDTVKLGNDRFTVKQALLITSFDSALYFIPPFKFVVGADTVLSNSLALKVVTFDVDLESKAFFDLKDIKKPPFVWADYIWYFIGALLALAFICAVLYAIKRWKYRKLNPFMVDSSAPKLPPHVVAINSLEELKSQKLWQQGMEKEYHTAITEILRTYIEERFNINAMEMTSNEILDIIRTDNQAKSSLTMLKQVLELADFVKFAKFRPLSDENEVSFYNACTFVSLTQEESPIETDKGQERAETP